jgi:hypothetical protein
VPLTRKALVIHGGGEEVLVADCTRVRDKAVFESGRSRPLRIAIVPTKEDRLLGCQVISHGTVLLIFLLERTTCKAKDRLLHLHRDIGASIVLRSINWEAPDCV